ncbi:MAG: phosphatase PAP2 family protein [Pseudomonadota bacterium]|nr:phosphatase PAP2 family protein [Pseudomonadota bacterium]
MNEIEAFNQALFLKINANAATPVWEINAAIFIAEYLIYLMPLILLYMWLWGDQARRNLAIKACLVAMIALGANQLIGLAWQHPRPFVIGLGHDYLQHAPDSSFPSDHATVFAGITLTLLFARARRLGSVTLLLGTCVAWARVFLGIHFPLDMLGAVVVASVVWTGVSPVWHRGGAMCTQLAERLYRKVMARPIAMGWTRR